MAAKRRAPAEPPQPAAALIADFAGIAPPAETPEPPPEPVSVPLVAADGSDYLRRQVYLDLYGTETPDDHQRRLLAIKDRSHAY